MGTAHGLLLASTALAGATGVLGPALLVCAGLSLWWSKKIFHTALAPLGVHGAVWFSALAIASLGLSPRYQRPWGTETWLALLGSEIVFALGCVASVILVPHARRAGWPRTIASSRLFMVILLLFALGQLGFLVQVRSVGGFATLVSDPIGARERFMLPGFGYLYSLLYLVPGMVVIYTSETGRWRRTAVGLGVASAIAATATVSRFGILLTLGITALGLWHTARSGAVRRRFWHLAVLGLVLFLVVGQYRESLGAAGFSATDRIVRGEVRIPKSLAITVSPYLYVVGGFENFDYQLAVAPTDGNGRYSLRAVLAIFGGDAELVAENRATGARLPHTKGDFLNTSIYLADYWLDFGWLGVTMGPFLLGLCTSLLFALRYRSPILVLANAVVLYSLAMTFFSNYFTYTPILFLVFVLLGAHVLVASSRSRLSRDSA